MTLQDLLSAAKNLNLQEQIQLASQLMQWVEAKAQASPNNLELTPRKPGLNMGAFVLDDDFDEPLPDEFWLGEL
jgi:hypothetical protein